ncbi:MAG: hypothetical protein ACEQSR_13635 [Candidatus Methylacidiphilales bacterium]
MLIIKSNAQISIGLNGGFGSGIDLGVAINGKNLSTNNGFGGGLNGRYWLNKKMAVGINISYFSFGVKDVPSGITSNYSVTPISLAFDYSFKDKGFKPFAGLEFGYLIGSWIAKYDENYGGINFPAFDGSYSNNDLFIAPTVGATYEINKNFEILLNAKYMFGYNGGKKDIKYSNSNLPSTQVVTVASSFVNVNLGISYKFGN